MRIIHDNASVANWWRRRLAVAHAGACVIFLFSVIAFPASAATWFVDLSNSSGTEDGTSWTTAFTTIQPAIDAAFGDGGGDVWVAQGIYNEVRVSPFHTPAVDTGSLILRNGVNVYGGFAGNETLLGQRDFVDNLSTIDGSTSRGGLPAFHVLLGAPNALLDGFTVTGGAASNVNPFDSRQGGALFHDTGLVTLRNSIFVDNQALSSFGGGAIYAFSGDLLIDGCTFTGNTATGNGGAIFCTGTCQILNSTFENNVSLNLAGGALSLSGGPVTITGCTFENNRADANGGAAGISAANVSISKCLFSRNNSLGGSSGGGALVLGNAVGSPVETHTISNCVFYKNSTVVRGSAISITGVDMGGGPTTMADIQTCSFNGNVSSSNSGVIDYDISGSTVTNCIISGNTGPSINPPNIIPVTFSIVAGGHVGAGNLDVNPLFVNVNTGDLRVLSSSPAVDAGTLTGAPADDFNSDPRPQGSGVDMGAFETNPAVPIVGAATTAALLAAALLLAAAGAYSLRRNLG